MSASPITKFLLARIAEDERLAAKARETTSGRWTVAGSLLLELHDRADGVPLAHPAIMSTEDYRLDDILDHVARQGPDRVLAECEAKRQIMEDCAHAMRKREVTHAAELAMDVLRTLACVYAQHSDFDPAWRLGAV